MVVYWDHQAKADAALAAIGSLLFWSVPNLGFPVIFTVNAEAVVTAARTWVGPTLTLLGMMAATTAFVFSVVDRNEFALLKESSSESQLWLIFSENLLWLAIAAIAAGGLTFWSGAFPSFVLYAATFLVIIVSISVLKFAWVMRQIISVRAARARKRSSQ